MNANGKAPPVIPGVQPPKVNLSPQDAMVLLYCDLATHMLGGMAAQLEGQVGQGEVAKEFAAAAGAFTAMRDKFVAKKTGRVQLAEAPLPSSKIQ